MQRQELSPGAYADRCDAVLAAIEVQVDHWLQDDVIDIDSQRTGGLLELAFPGGSKMVVNTQPPLQEIWVAARRGGHHFAFDGTRWCDTRTGASLEATLSTCASEQGGRTLVFKLP